MGKIISYLARATLIVISIIFIAYLAQLSIPTGDRVDINERWFRYGVASVPIVDNYSEKPLAFSLISPRELDKDDEIFYWLTEKGDLLTISNLSNRQIRGTLKFELSQNPCKEERTILIGTEQKQEIFSVPSKGSSNYSFAFLIAGGSSAFFSITPLPGNNCVLDSEDNRNFVAKISNITLSK
jgi:hypothetical protein